MWYDLVHHDGPFGDLQVGDHIQKGEPIAIVRIARENGRIEKGVDIAFRNGPRGPNTQIDPFYPDSYINVFPFVEDKLAKRVGVTSPNFLLWGSLNEEDYP